MNEKITITNITDMTCIIPGGPFIKYRFSDDPEDMVREYQVFPKWNDKLQAFEIMPAFPGKSVILL